MYHASAIVLARNNTQPAHVSRNVLAHMVKRLGHVPSSMPIKPNVRLRAPLLRLPTIKYIALSNPQKTYVQFAPCQRPLIPNVTTRLAKWRRSPNRLPPIGI